MKIKIALLILALCSVLGMSAQHFTVTGVVTDPEGEPLPGVSIFVQYS